MQVNHKTQIQALLADIDGLLSKTGGRLSWVMSGETAALHRQVLERVRNYLVSLDSELGVGAGFSSSSGDPQGNLLNPPVQELGVGAGFSSSSGDPQGNLLNPPVQEFGVRSDLPETGRKTEESPPIAGEPQGASPPDGSQATDQMGQIFVQLGDRFSQFMQPLQAELEMLLSQRQALVEEIRQLELHRQQDYSLAQQQANQQQMIAEFLQVLSGRLQESLKQQMAQTLANLEAQLLEIQATAEPTSTTQYTPTAIGSTSLTTDSSARSDLPPLVHPKARIEQLQLLQSEFDRRVRSLDSTIEVVFETLQRNTQTYQQSLSQALEKMHQTGVQGEYLFDTLVNRMAQQLTSLPATTNSPESSRGDSASRPYRQPSDLNANFLLDTSDLTANLDLPYPGTELSQTSLVGRQPTALPSAVEATAVEGNTPTTTDNPTASNLPSLDLSDLDFGDIEASDSGTDVDTLIQLAITPEAAANTLPQSPDEQLKTPEPSETKSDLDFILEQLGLELPTSTSANAAVETSQDSGQLPQNEVDELYESLFGSSSNIGQGEPSGTGTLPVDVDEPATEPLLQSLPSLVEAVAPDKSDELSTTPERGTQNNPPEALSASRIEPTIADPLRVDQPESADTIAALTDLRWDTDLGEQQLATLAPSDSQREQSPTVPSIPQPVIGDRPTWAEDGYIPASPEENLLAPEEAEPGSVHDILLDIETLEQLSEDLSNLEAENRETFLAPAVPPPALDESPPETEKKKLIETESQQVEVFNPKSRQFDATPLNGGNLRTGVAPQGGEPPNGKFAVPYGGKPSESAVSPHATGSKIQNPKSSDSWFLGIDVGTTGISAALLNHSAGELYPLYWSTHDYQDAISATRSFRLPSVAFLSTVEEKGRGGGGEMGEWGQKGQLATVAAPSTVTDRDTHGVLIKHLKPYLKVGIPYCSPGTGNCEPVLQLNDQQTVSLGVCVSLLSTLLATLNPDANANLEGDGLMPPMATVAATGMEPQTLHDVLGRITAVVFSCPDGWAEQYRFNLREAVLKAQLVTRPEQVCFVEEAIATVLSQLCSHSYKSLELTNSLQKRTRESSDWQGGTLAIAAGATMIELALVDLPENLQTLTHGDFTLHSLPYAGNAIDQDIICQLLYPQKWQRSPSNSSDTDWRGRDGWSWRSRIPDLDQMHWDSLQLEQLDLPRPGEPDLPARRKLQQRLESSLLGQALLEASEHLKLILQHEEQFTLSLADRQWDIQRRDMEALVFVPFVRRLNRELNRLLVATGMPVEAIERVICTGGTASLSAISRWLRQKLPKATIIQDLYRSDRPHSCSRVAYGLALLPLLPQVLDEHRQQYSDYFLLLELLRTLPDSTSEAMGRPYSLSEIILLLERRGINTRGCQHRLLALLEGQLPPGLVPSFADACWLTQESQQNLDYQMLSAAPMFERQANLLYCPNLQQLRSLRRYLSLVLSGTQQKLDEPYAVNFFE